MLFQQNLLQFEGDLLLFFLFHFVHIRRIRVYYIISIHIHCESSLFYLAEMSYFKRVPAIRSRLISYFFIVFFGSYNQQIHLFLIPVIKLLQILWNVKALIVGNCSCCIKFVFYMSIKWVMLLLLLMVNCCKLETHSFVLLMIILLIYY